jgi:uncharacterized protein YjbI with pentapeptide repeats
MREANLQGASLDGAKLKAVNLEDAMLQGASLDDANLKSANLKGAILQNGATADTNNELLNQRGAHLQGATMPSGQTYEDWLKDRDDGGGSGETTGLRDAT